MSTEGDDGPSVSAVEPRAEAGGVGGRASSRKAAAAAATTTKYSERSTNNSRSLDDSDSVVDEAQPALGIPAISLFVISVQRTSFNRNDKHPSFYEITIFIGTIVV